MAIDAAVVEKTNAKSYDGWGNSTPNSPLEEDLSPLTITTISIW